MTTSNEFLLTALAQHSGMFVLAIDSDARITTVIGKSNHNVNFDAQTAIGQPVEFYFANDPGHAKLFHDVLSNQQPQNVTFRTKNGEYFETQIVPLFDEQNQICGALSFENDVTKRETLAMMHKAQEEKLEGLFQDTEDGIYLLDRDFVIQRANGVATILHETEGELVGHVCYRRVFGRDEPCEFCPVVKTFHTGQSAEASYFDEKFQKHLQLKSTPLFDPQTENLIGVFETFRDITDTVKLEYNELQMQAIISGGNVPIAFGDASGTITFANAAFQALTGYSESELLGTRFWDTVYDERTRTDAPFLKIRADLYARKIDRHRQDITIRRKDGETRWVDFTASAVKDTKDVREQVIIILLDITDRYRIVQAFEEAHELAQIMLDTAPLGCHLIDQAGKILDCNSEAYKWFDISSKQEYCERFFELSPQYQSNSQLTADAYKEVIATIFEKGYLCFEWMHQKFDGTPVPCEVTGVRVKRKGDHIAVCYTRDLREREEMLAKIHKANEQSQIMLDATPMACTLVDRDGKLIACNLATARIFGLRDKQEYCERFWEFSPEYQPNGQLSLEMRREKHEVAFETGDQCYEWMCQKSDGSPLPCEVTLVRIRYGDDYVLAVYIRDLREHKAMLAKMREKDEQARMMLDANPQGCQIWDEHFGIIDCNTAVVNMFGFKDKQEYIDRFFELLPAQTGPNSSEMAFDYLKAALETGYQRFEVIQQLPDGTPFPCEITLVRIPGDNGYMICGYTRDLREHKQMMRDIEQRDKLLRVGNSTATTLLITPNENEYENSLLTSMEQIGRCLEVDRVQFWENETVDGELYFALKHQWISDFGQQKTTVPIGLKHPYSQFPDWEKLFSRGEYLNGPVSERPQEEQTILRVAEIDSIVLIPLLLRKRFWGFFVLNDCHQERTFSAEEIDILHSAGLLMINAIEKNAITLNLRDTAAQLEVALDRAQEANQAKSDFLASMSHEMRTPLNAVLGLSVLALESDSLDVESRTNIEKIYSAGDTLLSTVNDILDISKIESGKFELIFNEYDVPSLINDTTIQNMVRISSKPIEFILDIDETLPARLYGDELRVKQIFNNLLSNACKYTSQGTIELRVRCICEEDSVWMTIRVRDTGSGIREEDFGHLFCDYAQVNTKSNRHIEGTGLGLPISKKLVEMMDGSIHVESEYGKGSVFEAQIRQKLVTDAAIGPNLVESLKKFHYSDSKRVQNAKRTCSQMPYATVLIVDDVITNLDVAKGLLKPYAMQVHCVVGGQQAIDAVRDEKVRYNAIFMDHMMPEVDGIEATRQIRQIDTEYAKNVPIIAMTANAIVGNEQMFLNNGFQAFLSKPLDIPRLDAIVRLWVRDKEQDKLLAERHIEVDGQMILDKRNDGDRRSGIDRRSLQKIVETDMDMEAALQRFGDNWESLVNVLRSFVANTPSLLESIKEVNENNMANYAITVHGIKGASQGISADDAAGKALLLENAAKSGDFDFVKEHHSEFLESAFKLISHIKAMLVEIDANDSKPKKEKPDIHSLEKLLAACDNYDMDGVDAVMGEIEEYQYASDDGLAAWLRQNVDQMNFTQIKDKLSVLIGQQKV